MASARSIRSLRSNFLECAGLDGAFYYRLAPGTEAILRHS
jgi:hypothetical protein